MVRRKKLRPIDAVVADIEEAAGAAAELVARGKAQWDSDWLLQLAAEAIIGRIADAANRLPDEVKEAVPKVPWEDIRDIRILVDHIYHRIDYDALWRTLKDDIPQLIHELSRWMQSGKAL